MAATAALSLSTLANEAPAETPTNIGRVIVQGRPQDTASLYKVRNIMPALDALGGVRKMRCRAPLSGTPGWVTYTGLAREDVRFCFTLPIKQPTTLIRDMVTFVEKFPGSIFAIEFPNEPDLNPVTYGGMTDKRLGARTGNAPALMAFCHDVTNILSQTDELNHIPRVAFNDWMPVAQQGLVTYANSHRYPKPTSNPSFNVKSWKELLAKTGVAQGIITEWGRSTGGTSRNVVAPPVTLTQQAELLSEDLASILAEPSVAAVSLYELLSWKGTGEFDNFGLFNADLTPRPAVAAIRSLLASN